MRTRARAKKESALLEIIYIYRDNTIMLILILINDNPLTSLVEILIAVGPKIKITNRYYTVQSHDSRSFVQYKSILNHRYLVVRAQCTENL